MIELIFIVEHVAPEQLSKLITEVSQDTIPIKIQIEENIIHAETRNFSSPQSFLRKIIGWFKVEQLTIHCGNNDAVEPQETEERMSPNEVDNTDIATTPEGPEHSTPAAPAADNDVNVAGDNGTDKAEEVRQPSYAQRIRDAIYTHKRTFSIQTIVKMLPDVPRASIDANIQRELKAGNLKRDTRDGKPIPGKYKIKKHPEE